MDQWDDADHEQARDQEPDADIHHRFDHDVSCTTTNSSVTRMPRPDHALSGLAALSPGFAKNSVTTIRRAARKAGVAAMLW
jgi:hypothetical protein